MSRVEVERGDKTTPWLAISGPSKWITRGGEMCADCSKPIAGELLTECLGVSDGGQPREGERMFQA